VHIPHFLPRNLAPIQATIAHKTSERNRAPVQATTAHKTRIRDRVPIQATIAHKSRACNRASASAPHVHLAAPQPLRKVAQVANVPQHSRTVDDIRVALVKRVDTRVPMSTTTYNLLFSNYL
jgi:hypothetical protein